MSRELPSFGEAWYAAKKEAWRIDINPDGKVRPKRHKKRMFREDASRYYKQKFASAFRNLGMIKRESKAVFELRLPEAFKSVRLQTDRMLKREAKRINMKLMEMG